MKGDYEFMASRLFDKLRAKMFLRQVMHGISRESCELGQEVMLAKGANVSGAELRNQFCCYFLESRFGCFRQNHPSEPTRETI